MYLFYLNSYDYLSVSEVLIFTAFTPIYVSLFSQLINKGQKPIFWISTILAIVGALIIRQTNISENFIVGLIYVQLANICFAIGQVWYKTLISREESIEKIEQKDVFGFFFIGALIISTISFVIFGEIQIPQTNKQWAVIIWLGIVASGVGYFLWNKGASQVSSGTLAAMNNAVIPVGILINLVFFKSVASISTMLIGGLLIFLGAYLSSNRIKQKVNNYG